MDPLPTNPTPIPIQCRICGTIWYVRTLTTESDLRRQAFKRHGVPVADFLTILRPPKNPTP